MLIWLHKKTFFPETLVQTKLYDLIGHRSILLINKMQFSIVDVQFFEIFWKALDCLKGTRISQPKIAMKEMLQCNA